MQSYDILRVETLQIAKKAVGILCNKTLQQLLDEANIKQVEMARILNLSESQVSLLVNGKRRMNMDVAAVFANQLNTTIDVIYKAINFAKCNYDKTNKLAIS